MHTFLLILSFGIAVFGVYYYAKGLYENHRDAHYHKYMQARDDFRYGFPMENTIRVGSYISDHMPPSAHITYIMKQIGIAPVSEIFYEDDLSKDFMFTPEDFNFLRLKLLADGPQLQFGYKTSTGQWTNNRWYDKSYNWKFS